MQKNARTANLVIIFGVALVAVLTAVAANRFAHKQLTADTLSVKQCAGVNAVDHLISVENDVATPAHVDAHQCDTLSVTNKDDTIRDMAFGLHDHHTPYDGVTHMVMVKNQTLTVTLLQKGKFRIHDHSHDEVQATFTVSPHN